MQISPARTPGGSINLYHHVLAELIFTLKKEPSSGTFQLSLENKPFQKTPSEIRSILWGNAWRPTRIRFT